MAYASDTVPHAGFSKIASVWLTMPDGTIQGIPYPVGFTCDGTPWKSAHEWSECTLTALYPDKDEERELPLQGTLNIGLIAIDGRPEYLTLFWAIYDGTTQRLDNGRRTVTYRFRYRGRREAHKIQLQAEPPKQEGN